MNKCLQAIESSLICIIYIIYTIKIELLNRAWPMGTIITSSNKLSLCQKMKIEPFEFFAQFILQMARKYINVASKKPLKSCQRGEMAFPFLAAGSFFNRRFLMETMHCNAKGMRM